MKFEIEVDLDLPEEYELVGYDFLKKGDEYISYVHKNLTRIKTWSDDTPSIYKYMIVRKSKVLLRDIPYGAKFEFDGIIYVKVVVSSFIFETSSKNGFSVYIHAVKENIKEDYKVHTFMHDTFVTKVES